MSLAIYNSLFVKLKHVSIELEKVNVYKNASIFFVEGAVFHISFHLPFGYEDLKENMK